LEKIKESYTHIFSTDDFGMVGVTGENIKVKFWFSKDKEVGNIFIDSVYPMYE
jgi:hypothetical protein